MISRIKKFFQKKSTRSFKAARIDRTTGDWVLSPIKTNEDIRSSLKILVQRSRDLAKNNSMYRKYLAMRERNIFGAQGIILQAKIKNEKMNQKYGAQDVIANSIVEKAWQSWGSCREKAVSVDGKHTWKSFSKLVDRTLAVDGEVFIRKVKGKINKWGFSLQLLDSLDIDIDLNLLSPNENNGRVIIMGIEYSPEGKPLFYNFKNPSSHQYTAIPAEDILHIYTQEFIGQTRGFPASTAAILDMNFEDGLMEAELVSSRVAACQMGVWERPLGSTDRMDLEEETSGDTETAVKDFAPGVFEIGPKGWKLANVNPQKPGQQLTQFIKTVERKIANGLGVDYADLSNDVSEGNYSSNRYAALCARDGWKIEQAILIECFCLPVFYDWLEMALLTGNVNLPISKYEKFTDVSFVGRRWEALDPLRDIKADRESLDMRILSPQDLIRETGRDPDEVLEEIASWVKALVAHGLSPNNPVHIDKSSSNQDQDKDDKNED